MQAFPGGGSERVELRESGDPPAMKRSPARTVSVTVMGSPGILYAAAPGEDHGLAERWPDTRLRLPMPVTGVAFNT